MIEQRRERERKRRVARITLASRVHEGNRFRAIPARFQGQRQIESSTDIARIKRRRFPKRGHGLIEAGLVVKRESECVLRLHALRFSLDQPTRDHLGGACVA